MKLKSLIAATAVALAAAMPASAHEVQFGTLLSGANEIPVNVSGGSGIALITVDLDLLTMRVEANFTGLEANTVAAHIHCCTEIPGSINVGVATMVPSFVDFPLGVKSGTYDHTFDMALASSYNPAFVTAEGSVSNAFNALLAGMGTGNAYFNIHTVTFGGGEIRGLLNPVPEPATTALVGMGFAAMGWIARRSRIRA